MKPILSICIPTFQRRKAMGLTLKALVSEVKKYPKEIEICVSDNGSIDGTYDLLQKYAKKYPFIRIRRNPKNLGFDANVIAVLKMARGKYCWTMGDDDIIVPSRIIGLVNAIKGRNFIGGIVTPRFGARPNKVTEFFKKDVYSNKDFIQSYIKYIENMGAVENELSGFIGCYFFNKDKVHKICDKVRVSCYAWCHLVLFLHLISTFKGKIFVYKIPIIDDTIVESTDEKEINKIFLPGEVIEVFLDKKLSALEVLPVDEKLKKHIIMTIERERPHAYKKELIKLIVIRDITSESTYAKIKDRMHRLEAKIKYSAFDGLSIAFLKYIEENDILRKITRMFLMQIPRIKRVVDNMEKYNQGLLIANERRDDVLVPKK